MKRDTDNTGAWVKESSFGKWFLNTRTWEIHVLQRALNDLERLMHPRLDNYPVIIDIGCGYGHALPMLDQRFRPERLIGFDIDPDTIEPARARSSACNCKTEFLTGNGAAIELPDQSVDMVFCHQTFHHIPDQVNAIQEFYRILKPGGVLLFAESCRRYIHSLLIRLLFRHPMDVQKTDLEYMDLIRQAGFIIEPDAVSRPFLWWSREDLGLLEKIGITEDPDKREETLVNLVARRPA